MDIILSVIISSIDEKDRRNIFSRYLKKSRKVALPPSPITIPKYNELLPVATTLPKNIVLQWIIILQQKLVLQTRTFIHRKQQNARNQFQQTKKSILDQFIKNIQCKWTRRSEKTNSPNFNYSIDLTIKNLWIDPKTNPKNLRSWG